MTAVETKFRTAMAKAFAIGGLQRRALLAFSGGSASRLMVDLIHSIVQQSKGVGRSKLPEELVLCYIDQGAVDATEYLAEMHAIARVYNLELHVHKMEDMFEGHEEGDARRRLEHLFSLAGKPDTKDDLLQHLRLNALTQCARQHNCSAILLGDSATRIAIKSLALTSKGRGYALPLEIGLAAMHDGSPLFFCNQSSLQVFCSFDRCAICSSRRLSLIAATSSSTCPLFRPRHSSTPRCVRLIVSLKASHCIV
jgi:tRNA(Ile)-lysidine synthase TilS/MesJ